MAVNSRIVIVEDEVIVALAIEAQLMDFGYEVPGIFSSGEEVLKKIEELKPDLILMDFKLSGLMNGIEAATSICLSYDIPLIFLTGYLNGAMLEQVKLSGLGCLIVKPFRNEELISAIELSIRKMQARWC